MLVLVVLHKQSNRQICISIAKLLCFNYFIYFIYVATPKFAQSLFCFCLFHAGLHLLQETCPGQSLQTWALPSSRPSSSMLPWLTPSWNICAYLTLTLNPPLHATQGSSALLVGLYFLRPLPDNKL